MPPLGLQDGFGQGGKMRSFFVKRALGRLRYQEFDGIGPPLLVLHGIGCASSFEYPRVAQAAALRGRHLLLVDLLGFGYSDHPGDFGYGISDHAAALADLVEARGFDAVRLFGHSMGGSVAIELADLLGTRVRNPVLAEGNLDPGGGQFSRPVAAMGEAAYLRDGHCDSIRASLAEGDDAWATTLQAALPLAVFRGAASLVAGGRPDWRQSFLGHPARKAFIFGEQSLSDPDAKALADAGVQVLIVRDAGHAMGIDNPEGLASAIAEALDA